MPQLKDFSRHGSYVTLNTPDEVVKAFVPTPLPPEPRLRFEEFQVLLEQANQALGRLDGFASVLPDVSLFIYSYLRKEALLSSQIEGTQSSLSDLLLYESNEAPGVPVHDVVEVSNYVAALNHGLERMRSGFPLSLRLIREIHGVLLKQSRGEDKEPGEFRRSQNWIGGTRPGNAYFVPPPAELVIQCMGELEKFIHAEGDHIPALVRAGLVHVQFETIHPFLDGNGRIGRLLITLMLCACGALQEPILYLSLFLKTHRHTYYDLLTQVRKTGNWESWLVFFLTGVRDTSEQAVATAKRILNLLEADEKRIETLKRPAASAMRVFQLVRRSPILSIAWAAERSGLSIPTTTKSIDHLIKLGILKELGSHKREKRFVYEAYMKILNEGTEPLR